MKRNAYYVKFDSFYIYISIIHIIYIYILYLYICRVDSLIWIWLWLWLFYFFTISSTYCLSFIERTMNKIGKKSDFVMSVWNWLLERIFLDLSDRWWNNYKKKSWICILNTKINKAIFLRLLVSFFFGFSPFHLLLVSLVKFRRKQMTFCIEQHFERREKKTFRNTILTHEFIFDAMD